MKRPNNYHTCACRDCLVETTQGLCQRCLRHGCSAQGDRECRVPAAYEFTAKKVDGVNR